MELTENPATEGNGAAGEPSVASSLEHLVAGSQGVITKRIDLALLEGQELLSHSIARFALAGAGMALAAAAWFAGVGAFILFVAPDANPVIRLTAFGLLNGAGAVGCVTLARRHSRPPARAHANGNGPMPSERKT